MKLSTTAFIICSFILIGKAFWAADPWGVLAGFLFLLGIVSSVIEGEFGSDVDDE